MLRGRLLICFQSPQNPLTVNIGKKFRLIWKVKDHPERRNANDNSRQAFQNEDPRPSFFVAYSIHVGNCRRQQSTKGSRHGRGREKDGCSDPKFASFIPTGKVVIDARKETGLGQTQKEPRRHQSRPIVNQSHGGHTQSPRQHNCWYEDAGAKSLEQYIGDGFGQGVGHEEDGEGGIILPAGDVQALQQAIQFCVPNICPVEEAYQIEETQPWDEPEIKFPQECSVLWVGMFDQQAHRVQWNRCGVE